MVSTLTPAVQAALQVEADFQALTIAYGLQVVEVDASTLTGFYAHYLAVGDERILVVPAGQDSAARLWAARSLLAHQGVTPVRPQSS